MSKWRLAKSLETLREQVNNLAPYRSKASDGTRASTQHSKQNPTSDHEPNSLGVVTALDLTHDPKEGFDSYAFAKHLVANPDPRLKYVISNGQIASREKGWKWRKYTGKNPHDHHVHVSVMGKYDKTDPWDILVTGSDQDHNPERHPVLRKGSEGEDVKMLQSFLGVTVDGDFGPKTEKAVKAFQRKHKLVADGVVGPMTWQAMENSL